MLPVRRCAAVLAVLVTTTLLLAGCGGDDGQGSNADPDQVDAVEKPELGACRMLTPDDVAAASNASKVVDCADEHTAQTYAVGGLPDQLSDAGYDDEKIGAWAYDTCAKQFEDFLGADESLVMRTVVSWAWFRPSEKAWEDGARWYRCDVVGGGEQSKAYVPLPEETKGLLLGKPDDQWMVCAAGPSVSGSVKIPCTEAHDWRAISTVKLGEPKDPYPGDRLSQVKTRDFCSEQVAAFLNYPVDYDFGYTWFHEAEWQAGNRRSVCWARTNA
ncbi:septum formation family protein [Nocardioides sp. KIGAM211]|uniref:Septum formation family protein n=1 Tax=Nocardioides luti TaxID=2761101 RepID=A0A7X0RLU4_9ACTN|nr:septum formation family protein [Nocardioides luti]MBB6629363.1 septum formation family protein [Nocardioides luti]